MKNQPFFISKSLLGFLIVLSGISTLYLIGVITVPFHPDESTQLFTSGDVELFFQNPSALFWKMDQERNLRQQYRELDAPLTHSMIAMGRWFASLPALPVDWNWSITWQENQQAGAVPSPQLLMAGRMAVAALFPFSMLFFFLAVRRATNEFTVWAAALLLATNALVWLHTRRVMAEGGLLFTLSLTLWTVVKAEKRPWLAAIPVALAFCAKQSLAALALLGPLAMLWSLFVQTGETARQKYTRLLHHLIFYGLIFVTVVFLLNPFLWAQPIPAVKAAIQSRQALARAQTQDRPDQALNTPGRKIIGLVGSVYLTPPIMAETGNYMNETQAAETAYLANPLNTLFRSIPAGGLLMLLGLFGFLLGSRRALKPGGHARRALFLLLATSLLQTLALLALIPLPWQRYYLPVVPYACLWAAYGLDQIKELVFRARLQRVAPAQ